VQWHSDKFAHFMVLGPNTLLVCIIIDSKFYLFQFGFCLVSNTGTSGQIRLEWVLSVRFSMLLHGSHRLLRLLNISAKNYKKRSLQFWAIPFQSWCIFWDRVYISHSHVTFRSTWKLSAVITSVNYGNILTRNRHYAVCQNTNYVVNLFTEHIMPRHASSSCREDLTAICENNIWKFYFQTIHLALLATAN